MKGVSEKELKHHTRRLSIKEGIFCTIRNAFADNYLSAFAIALGTQSFLVAILNSIWNLGPATQLLGAKFVGKIKRKKILKKSIAVEALAWIFIAFSGVLYLKNILVGFLPFFIIAGLIVMVSASGIGHPSWFSLMGDVVDSKYRGRWWSKRSTLIYFTTVLFSVIAAVVLNCFRTTGKEIFGFILLFVVAAIARFYCARLIGKHYEPEFKTQKTKNFSLKKLLRNSKKSNFGKFILFRGMFSFTIGLTSPLVSIYLLRDLGLDYLTYILIYLAGTLFSIITLNFWGKISDKYGNYRVIALTTLIIPLTPILWILSANKFYLFFIPSLIGGTAWTAFMMASGNFIYDNVQKQKRGKAISYYNLLIGLGALVGGIVSAVLIGTLNTDWIEPLYLIFLIGAICRMVVVAFWIPGIREIKRKEISLGLGELKKTFFKEIKPTLSEDLHEIASIRHYLSEK